MSGRVRQFRRWRARRLWVVGAAAVAVAAMTVGATRAFGDPNPGQFQLQGDTTQTAGQPGDDWNNVFAGTAGDFGHTFILGDTEAPGNDTTAWNQGTKVDQPINQWAWQTNTSVINAKADITDAYAAAYKGPSNHTIMYFGLDRFDNNGDASVGFWFLQDPSFALNPDGSFSGQHQEGDVFIKSQFLNGGGISNPVAYYWHNGSLQPLVTGAVCNSSTQVLCAIDNQDSAITAPWPYTAKGGSGQTQIPTNAFFEGGFDLSTQFNTINVPCFTHFLALTETSQGNSETLKDLAAGNVESCGTIELKKHWVGPAGTTQLSVGTTAGAHDVLGPTSVSGSDGTTGSAQVHAGTYYLSENLTNASAYTSSIYCFEDRNQNGTQDANEPTVATSTASPGWSVPLGVGDHILCTITNTQIPQVKVVKALVPSSDSGRFDLQIDGSSPNAGSTNVGDGGTTGFVNETVGATPTVGEVGHDGTDLDNYFSSIACSNGQSGTGTSLELNALAAGDQITCTITNKRKPTLTVNKVVVPANDTGRFDLQIDGQTAGTGAGVGNGGTTGPVVVPIGSHTVGEAAGDGTSLSDYASAISGDCAANGSVTLAAGDNKVCTITNTRKATIVVKKVMVGGTGSFTFTGHPAGTISTSGGTILEHVAPGQQYVSTETPTAGWRLTDVSCDNADGTGDTTGGTATFNPSAGQTITCTFTNTKVSSISIVKTAVGGDDTFSYTTSLNLDPSGGFDLTTANGTNEKVYNDLLPATYTVREGDEPHGWQFTSLDCGQADGTSVDGRTATIRLAAGEDVVCTYTNTKQATIVVKKLMVGGTDSFTFTGDPAGTISTSGGTISETVAPGEQYVSTETPTAGWQLADVSCDNGDGTGDTTAGTATFNPSAGQTITCTFTNTRQPTITVDKVVQPSNDDGTFDFTIGDQTLTNGGDGYGNGDSTGPVVVLPGSHAISESGHGDTNASDYASSWSCSDESSGTGTSIQTGALTPGENLTCTFTNVRKGTIRIVKNTLGGDGTFQFTSGGGLPSPADPESGNFALTTTDGSATQDFSVAPGDDYSVAETVPSGWSLTGLSCSRPSESDPSGGTVDEGNSSKADITVAPGGFVQCTFTNTKLATLIIKKLVDNSNGGGSKGPGDFTIHVQSNGADIAGSPQPGSSSGTTYTGLAPGTYTVTENTVSGYSLTSNTCAGGAKLNAGQTVTCTLTNTSAAPPPKPTPPTPPSIDLAVTKVGTPNPQTVNKNVTWTMVVTNNGPDAATGVTAGDPLPAGTTFVSVTTTQGTCTGGSTVQCSIGSMAAGASVTITLVTTAVQTGTLTNTVTVVGNETETNTANNTASASVQANGPFVPPKVVCSAVLASPRLLYVGRNATLTLHVTKAGRPAKGVRIRITGPGLHMVTAPSSAKGVIKMKVRPKKAGIVRFTVVRPNKTCKVARVGITGVFTPPVTG